MATVTVDAALVTGEPAGGVPEAVALLETLPESTST